MPQTCITFCLFSAEMVHLAAKMNLRPYVIFIKPRNFDTAYISDISSNGLSNIWILLGNSQIIMSNVLRVQRFILFKDRLRACSKFFNESYVMGLALCTFCYPPLAVCKV